MNEGYNSLKTPTVKTEKYPYFHEMPDEQVNILVINLKMNTQINKTLIGIYVHDNTVSVVIKCCSVLAHGNMFTSVCTQNVPTWPSRNLSSVPTTQLGWGSLGLQKQA